MTPMTLAALVVVGTATAWAQDAGQVRLTLQAGGGQHVFRRGELIELELSFQASPPQRYQIDLAGYDRSGRLGLDEFLVTPTQGVIDPLRTYFASQRGMIGGGLRGFGYLSDKPTVVKRDLNEWVRFDRAGTYRVTVVSQRVSEKENGPYKPVQVRSNEIEVEIVDAEPDWQRQHFAAIVQDLDKPGDRARRALRYLGTDDAARLLAERLRDDDHNTAWDFACGLIGSPARAAARAAVEEMLADPGFPVTPLFLTVLSILPLNPGDGPDALIAARERNLEGAVSRLIEVLSRKQGKAAATSVDTAISALGKDAPAELRARLSAQLVRSFEQLPPGRQTALLEYDWDRMRSRDLLPVLRRVAQQESEQGERYLATGAALRRWYELDPGGARGTVLAEIARPDTRFDARVLGILPDQTLPEVEAALARNFLAPERGYMATERAASLLARYASGAVLAQLLPRIQEMTGVWACEPQAAALAYVVKVDPNSARSLLERAVAARGPKNNACRRTVFTQIAAFRTGPVLTESAIRALDDDDPEVAVDAVRYLERHGPEAAEPLLWRRYEMWSRQWANRAAELRQEPAHANLGGVLAQALATGTAWLADAPKLDRLRALAATDDQRRMAENWRAYWQTLQIMHIPGSTQFSVAQYHVDTRAALEQKLAQFPAGTEFRWTAAEPSISAEQERVFAELSAWARGHGISIRR